MFSSATIQQKIATEKVGRVIESREKCNEIVNQLVDSISHTSLIQISIFPLIPNNDREVLDFCKPLFSAFFSCSRRFEIAFQLTEQELEKLLVFIDRLRTFLVMHYDKLTTTNESFDGEKQEFISYSIDTFAIEALSLAQLLLIRRGDTSIFTNLKKKTPAHYALLKELCVIPHLLYNRKILSYDIGDIILSINCLNARWLACTPSLELDNYIDLLLLRVSMLRYEAAPAQFETEFTEEISQRVEDNQRVISMKAQQSLFWMLLEMKRKISHSLPFQIHFDTLLVFETRRQEHIKNLLNTHARGPDSDFIQSQFFKLAFLAMEGPGERSMFKRDHAEKNLTSFDIISKAGRKDSAKRYSEILGKHPKQIIAEDALNFDYLEQLLYALIFSAYVKSILKIDFLKLMLVTNAQLLESRGNPIELVNQRTLPTLVQWENKFGLWYNQKFYPYGCIFQSILHWRYIIASPPFNHVLESIEVAELAF